MEQGTGIGSRVGEVSSTSDTFSTVTGRKELVGIGVGLGAEPETEDIPLN